MPTHSHFMQHALALAKRGLGTTAPNPSVGCVIVKNGQIIGRGVTATGGRPHAETVALAQAGEAARGATAYITLEPCCHHGQTPPCSEALIAAGIKTAVIALKDPFPKVAGKGIEQLKMAGIEVIDGIGQEEATKINAGFLSVHMQGRPMVTLKLATSLDGKIATKSGESQWITSEAARHYAHWLRAEHDAIMVGTNTALHDNPSLTCRLPGLAARSPIRIVVDGQLKLPATYQLAANFTWVLTQEGQRNAALEATGVELVSCPYTPETGIDLAAALQLLAQKGITRLLVEGGGRLAASLLTAGLVDRIIWIRAPILLGNDALPAIEGLNLATLGEARCWGLLASRRAGGDVVEEWISIATPTKE